MNRLDAAVEAILGTDALNTPLADEPEPDVVFVGPYNGGKSSLLRRLLVEDGSPVPSWLTVSSQPETFEARHVVSGGVRYWDTPGMAGRAKQHDLIAAESLGHADFAVLVLPPGRNADDTGHLKLLAEAGFTGQETVILLSRKDSIGDPVYAPDEHATEVAARIAVLRKLLPAPLANAAVLPIAAVPFGAAPDGASGYGTTREWDGVDELRAVLSALPERLAALRAAHRLRFRRSVLAFARRAAEDQIRDARKGIEEFEEREERADLLRRRLTELDAAAGEELTSLVGRELRAVVRAAGGMAAEDVRSTTENRLTVALGAWDRTWNRKLSDLAGEAQLTLVERTTRASSVLLDDWADRLRADPREPLIRLSEETLERFVAPVKLIAQKSVKMRVSSTRPLEETLKAAQAVNEKVRSHNAEFLSSLRDLHAQRAKIRKGPVEGIAGGLKDSLAAEALLRKQHDTRLAELVARSEFFDSLKDADRARRWIKGLDIVGEFAPAAISLGGLVGSLVADGRAKKADEQRRVADNQTIADATEKFSAQILGREEARDGSWEADVQALRAQLTMTAEEKSAAAAAAARIVELEQALADL